MSVLHELWICEVCKYDPEKIYKYLNFFGDAKSAFLAKSSEYKKHEDYPFLEAFLKEKRSLASAETLLEECERKEIDIMSISDEDYPEYLKNGYLPPRILFLKGERLNLNKYVTISIVGSRAATRNGKLMAHDLAEDLSLAGALVVSGMAKGIDAAAHKGALSAGGKTIAVLAGGVDIIYPAENRELYYQILENGTIMSEQPPGTAGRDYFYQRRNRIMAGLSYGCVLVEGRDGSGSSITMKHATSANRDLFAVPGNPKIDLFSVPNKLIKDGATMVTDCSDILNVYEDNFYHLLENGKKELITSQSSAVELDFDYSLDEDDKKIIEFLSGCGEAQSPDSICEACQIPASVVASKLTLLMMSGILSRDITNKYSLIRR